MKQIILTVRLISLFLFFTLTTQKMMAQKTATDMVKAAKQEIENLTPRQAYDEIMKGNITVIDIREPDELKQTGTIAGAVNAPRGMLEFYADPSLPYHKPEFDKEKRIILYCASSGRSALAVKTLKEMGYTNVAHIDGGIKAWETAGLPIAKQ